mmetsp:Transcript_40574/g.85160  ORF Transcript_40574/g.85160 Transcript_40574/m.85160 type:complete len:204 (-) Transcript_40574:354-965(-)
MVRPSGKNTGVLCPAPLEKGATMMKTKRRRNRRKKRNPATRKWKSRKKRGRWRRFPPLPPRRGRGERQFVLPEWILSFPTEWTASYRRRRSTCANLAMKRPWSTRHRNNCTRCCSRRRQTGTRRRRACLHQIMPTFCPGRVRARTCRREQRACCRNPCRELGLRGRQVSKRTKRTRRKSLARSSNFEWCFVLHAIELVYGRPW